MGKLTKMTIANLNPEIRDLVVWLNEMGYETTDSGDGTNHTNGMEGALEFPHIAVLFNPNQSRWQNAILQARDLHKELKERGIKFGYLDKDPIIELHYNPEDDTALIMVCNVTSDMVDMRPKEETG